MRILDCTLRDGGYYTSWNFSKSLFENYLRTVSKLDISIIELGYLSDAKDENGLFYHLNKQILKKAKSLLRKDQKVYAMINFKEIKNTKQLDHLLFDKVNVLDGIRFAVPPKNLNQLTEIINPIRKKYKTITFNANLMYLSKWIEDKNVLKKIFSNISGNINTLSFVDSFGALMPNQIDVFFKKLKMFKKTNIKIGCHFHNNCGLALANTLAANTSGCDVIDTTFTGMGRGAGNAETELILANISAQKKISGFELSNLLEIFDSMKKKMNWGSSFAYAFAAINGFSQSEMMDLIQNRRLDPGTAVKAISNARYGIKQIKFKKINNLTKLKKCKKNFPIVIGGAPSLIDYGDYFFDKINIKSPVILSGSNALFNFLRLEIKVYNPIILILSGSEIKKINVLKNKNFYNKINLYGIIAEEEFLPKSISFKNKKNIATSNTVALNPVFLAGLVFKSLKIKTFSLAFFDGNPENEKGRIVMKDTQDSVNKLNEMGIKINTLTKSYLKVKRINFW